MKKRKGQVDIIVMLFMLLIIIILVAAQMQLAQFRSTKNYVEDALAASNLASAVIDIEAYGIAHDLLIAEPEEAYELYQQAIKINLNLDDFWESPNKASISGKVEILNYTIYNVTGSDIDMYSFTGGGMTYTKINGGVGNVTAPEGSVITSTSVYSMIGFPVKGVFGIHVDAKQEKLVDIIKNE